MLTFRKSDPGAGIVSCDVEHHPDGSYRCNLAQNIDQGVKSVSSINSGLRTGGLLMSLAKRLQAVVQVTAYTVLNKQVIC